MIRSIHSLLPNHIPIAETGGMENTDTDDKGLGRITSQTGKDDVDETGTETGTETENEDVRIVTLLIEGIGIDIVIRIEVTHDMTHMIRKKKRGSDDVNDDRGSATGEKGGREKIVSVNEQTDLTVLVRTKTHSLRLLTRNHLGKQETASSPKTSNLVPNEVIHSNNSLSMKKRQSLNPQIDT